MTRLLPLASLALGIALGVVAALWLVFWRSGAEPDEPPVTEPVGTGDRATTAQLSVGAGRVRRRGGGRVSVTEFAMGDGATAAVEALAETWCYLGRHSHTATRPACADSRRFADRTLALLVLARPRATAVGEFLMDRVVAGITADMERSVT